jgi:hypothetical protein
MALVAVVMALVPSTLTASVRTDVPRAVEYHKYSKLYNAVRREEGPRAPGRNVRKYGVRFKWVGKRSRHWAIRPPTAHELAVSIRQLRQLRRPMIRAVPPPRPPFGVHSPAVVSPIPQAIVACESGGDPTAVNTGNPNRPAGMFQIITSTWIAYGGGQYAPTADKATVAEQSIIAAKIWDGGRGAGQWECKA